MPDEEGQRRLSEGVVEVEVFSRYARPPARLSRGATWIDPTIAQDSRSSWSVSCLNEKSTTRPPPGIRGPLYEESNRQRMHSLSPLWPATFFGSFSGIAGCRKLDAGEAQGNQWGVLRLDAHLDPDPGPESGQGQSRPGSHGSSMGRPLRNPVLDFERGKLICSRPRQSNRFKLRLSGASGECIVELGETLSLFDDAAARSSRTVPS